MGIRECFRNRRACGAIGRGFGSADEFNFRAFAGGPGDAREPDPLVHWPIKLGTALSEHEAGENAFGHNERVVVISSRINREHCCSGRAMWTPTTFLEHSAATCPNYEMS